MASNLPVYKSDYIICLFIVFFNIYEAVCWSCVCMISAEKRKLACTKKKIPSIKKKSVVIKSLSVEKGGKDAGRRGLIHVVKPVDEIKKGKDGGKYYPRPSIDGVDVRKIRDFDFQLRGASAQSSLFGRCASLLAVPPRPAHPPVLDP